MNTEVLEKEEAVEVVAKETIWKCYKITDLEETDYIIASSFEHAVKKYQNQCLDSLDPPDYEPAKIECLGRVII